MCGIAGIVRVRGDRRVTGEAVDAALKAMADRGPDGPYVFNDGEQVVIGQCRLSIIDLISSAEQRMELMALSPEQQSLQCRASTARPLRLTFNGEIYNYQSLMTELEQLGHTFRSRSDSEVILHSFEEWGEICFERFRGMFAIALWDVGSQRLTLARDRFGIKPLYYAETNERLFFASELGGLLKLGRLDRTIDPVVVNCFLRNGWISQPRTLYRDIRALAPGSILTVERNRMQQKSFASIIAPFTEPSRIISFSEAVKETRLSLRDSVQAHLVADVEVGAFLSGGVDSSALVGLMRELGQGKLTTISAIFIGTPLDESAKARLVAKRFATNHIELPISEDDFIGALDDIFDHMDQPTVDGVNTYFVSLAAKRAGLRVVLSGLGGDELFAGYPSFAAIPKLLSLRPFLSSRAGMAALRFLCNREPFNRTYAKLLEFAENAEQLPPVARAYLSYRNLFTEPQLRQLLKSDWIKLFIDHQQIDERASITIPPIIELEKQVAFLELTQYLQQQLLRDTDVFSMAHSIEARVPFVDHELLNVITRLPSRFKSGKHLLIEAVRDLLPAELIGQRKQGFVVPMALWLRGAVRPIIEAELTNSPLFERAAIDRLWALFLCDRVHWSRVWSLFVANRFLRNTI